jgi:hypothetical protein
VPERAPISDGKKVLEIAPFLTAKTLEKTKAFLAVKTGAGNNPGF